MLKLSLKRIDIVTVAYTSNGPVEGLAREVPAVRACTVKGCRLQLLNIYKSIPFRKLSRQV